MVHAAAPVCWTALAPSAVELPAMARGLPLLRLTMWYVPGVGPLLGPLGGKYSIESVNGGGPPLGGGSTRWIPGPLAGGVNGTGGVTRGPSGRVGGVKAVLRTAGTNAAQADSSVYGRRSLASLPRLAIVEVANHSKPCLLLQAGQMYSPSPRGRPVPDQSCEP